jgi:hypothetical protein
MAASAGELIAEPGDFEYDEFKLTIESVVLSWRVGITIGGVTAGPRLSRGLDSVGNSLVSTVEGERMCKDGTPTESCFGVSCEGAADVIEGWL